MKYEAASLNTKKMISNAFKEILKTKSFSKITVSEIIEACSINRKTFYYHFTDINDLLKWTLEQEAILVVQQFDLIEEYEEAITFVMNYVEKNEVILKNIYYSLGGDELKRFFYADFYQMADSVITKVERHEGITLDDEFRQFLKFFYTEALVGILFDYVVTLDTTKNKEKLIDYIHTTLKASIPNVIHEYDDSKAK